MGTALLKHSEDSLNSSRKHPEASIHLALWFMSNVFKYLYSYLKEKAFGDSPKLAVNLMPYFPAGRSLMRFLLYPQQIAEAWWPMGPRRFVLNRWGKMSQPLAPTVCIRVLLTEWTGSAGITRMVESKDGVSSGAGLKVWFRSPLCVHFVCNQGDREQGFVEGTHVRSVRSMRNTWAEHLITLGCFYLGCKRRNKFTSIIYLVCEARLWQNTEEWTYITCINPCAFLF